MNRLFHARTLLAAAFAVGALAVGNAAHARSDVHLSIGVQAPFGYVEPAPVYVQPRTVYVQPQPVYVQTQPVYVQPQPVYYYDNYNYNYGHHHRPHGRHGGAWGDADRDGVPNAYDRAPNNPYRR